MKKSKPKKGKIDNNESSYQNPQEDSIIKPEENN